MPGLKSVWYRIQEEVRHGLAMNPPLVPTDADQKIIDKIAAYIIKRKMTTAAILFLETGKPLNFVASQFLVFIQPFATFLLNQQEYERFTRILEHRQGVELLIQAINRADTEGLASFMRDEETPEETDRGDQEETRT
jgi:hypothetical protein